MIYVIVKVTEIDVRASETLYQINDINQLVPGRRLIELGTSINRERLDCMWHCNQVSWVTDAGASNGQYIDIYWGVYDRTWPAMGKFYKIESVMRLSPRDYRV
jgi:hypothetical protein